MVTKQEDKIICISLNMRGLKVEVWGIKNDILRNVLIQSNADIMGLQECNINWSKTLFKDK